MAMPTFSMRQLLEAGVHFGHHTRRWNPKMGQYIFGVRNGVHIIDLGQSVPLLQQGIEAIRAVAASGGRVLFVGTKRQASEKIAESAKRCGQYYVNHRWLGGMLSNWKTISQSIKRLRELDERLQGNTGGLTKKDVKIVDPGYAHVPMILAGKVDAAHGLTYSEGMATNEELEKQGRKPVRWLLYRDFGVPPFYYQVMVGSENWVKAHPNAVCRFLRATLKGLDVWLSKPDDALAQIAKDNDQFTPAQHRKIYDGSKDHWKTKDGVAFRQDEQVWKEAQDWAVAQKLLTLTEDPKNYFTNDYLP